MNYQIKSIIITVFVSFLITGKTSHMPKLQEEITMISAHELNEMLADKDFTLVNVHIPYAGEIPGTDLFIPFHSVRKNLDKLPDKNAKIVLYCMSDPMSTMVAKKLAKRGFSNLYNLEGGMKGWKKAGYELVMRDDK